MKYLNKTAELWIIHGNLMADIQIKASSYRVSLCRWSKGFCVSILHIIISPSRFAVATTPREAHRPMVTMLDLETLLDSQEIFMFTSESYKAQYRQKWRLHPVERILLCQFFLMLVLDVSVTRKVPKWEKKNLYAAYCQLTWAQRLHELFSPCLGWVSPFICTLKLEYS